MSAKARTGADPRRSLPSVDELLRERAAQDLEARFGRAALLREARALLDGVRGKIARGESVDVDEPGHWLAALRGRMESTMAESLKRVINATGVVVHTNLGRAPLGARAARRVVEIASGYSNLEYDLDSGGRSNREAHAEARLRRLVGAEGSAVVNNCAAAVLLAVNTFAEGRQVLVSRGELVEIGGSFRIPEILRKGGARLVEVGTTNRTRVSDYENALSPDVGLILRVHPSNFRIIGFTESPSMAELVELARAANVPLVEDLGSGMITRPHGLESEPTVSESLATGAGVVTFSGDKLLGGPQAGLIVGRDDLVAAMRRNPLYRALRVDKMTIAALDAVLEEHESGRAIANVPVVSMLQASAAEIRRRAEGLAARIREMSPGLVVSVEDGASAVGGGAAPTLELPTTVVTLSSPALGASAMADALRAWECPIVARIAGDRLVIDLRTVAPEDDDVVAAAVAAASAGG